MARAVERIMWERLFELSSRSSGPLQARIRETIVAAILDARLSPGSAVPSSRELAERLGVARNTVVLAYQHLLDDGFLVSRERSGYFVNPHGARDRPGPKASPRAAGGSRPEWSSRFTVRPSGQRNIVKAADWQAYPYPFLYGQFDPGLFPMADWRECSRRALSAAELRGWAPDLIDGDDPLLIEQIRTRILPHRGVWAAPAEVMITIGAQQALFLLAELLVGNRTTVGVEDPGYPDARNIFALRTSRIRSIPVDDDGPVIDDRVSGCDYLCLTPSCHCPTTTTMTQARRHELLARAAEHDFLIIEDDYETQTSFSEAPSPALKSLDRSERVIYIGSLSKTLAPGLRLGYIVGAPELIEEARALRRLMVRHPAANNQRTAALFLSLGQHEVLTRRLAQIHRERSATLKWALNRHLPEFAFRAGEGPSSYWLKGPAWLDARRLAERAKDRGVLIEPGDIFFVSESPPTNYVRLGFSSIAKERIEAGIVELASLVADMWRERRGSVVAVAV